MVQTQHRLLTALLILAMVVAVHLLDQAQFGRANVVMVYMLVVVIVAELRGLWVAVVVSALGLPLFRIFDTPPYFALNEDELEHTFPLAVMLVTAVTVSGLAGRLRLQAAESERRAVQAAALYALSDELAGDLPEPEILAITARHVALAFNVDVGRDAAVAGGLPAIAAQVPAGSDEKHKQAMLRLAEQALERAALRDRVRASELRVQQEALRSSILGAVSHDLRTPLASIIGASSSLLDHGEEFAVETRQRLGKVIHGEALQMLRMVENLLDFARLRSAGGVLETEWLAIEEIVGSALASVRRRVRDHRLEVSVPPDLPLLRCNGVLLERVLTNLIENAVKFSPTGTLIRLSADVEDGDMRIRVSDAGAGIDPALRDKVFEPFTRFGNQEGSGLGLAICRGIVEAHQGSIHVESSAAGGSCFVVRLPLGGVAPVMPANEDVVRTAE